MAEPNKTMHPDATAALYHDCTLWIRFLVLESDDYHVEENWPKFVQFLNNSSNLHSVDVAQDLLRIVLLRHSPVEIVTKMISMLNPSILMKSTSVLNVTFDGRPVHSGVPLCVAIECGAPNELVRVLLRETIDYCKQAKKRKRNESEYDRLISILGSLNWGGHMTLDTMIVILEECPEAVWAPRGKAIVMSSVMYNIKTSNSLYWNKLKLVLLAATFGTVKETELNGQMFFVLHSFLEVIVNSNFRATSPSGHSVHHQNRKILDLIKARVPQQFRARGNDGSLPIHIIVTNSLGLTSDHSRLLSYVLKEYPESARIANGHGRLPLHVAAESGHKAFVRILAEAEPRAIQTRCSATHLLPWQLAAYGEALRRQETVAFEKYRDVPKARDIVDTTFQLLLKAPHVIQHVSITEPSPWVESAAYKELLHNNLKMEQLIMRNKKLKLEIQCARESQAG